MKPWPAGPGWWRARSFLRRPKRLRPIDVLVRGGDTLQVGFAREGENFRNVTLTGPADFVFDGTIDL